MPCIWPCINGELDVLFRTSPRLPWKARKASARRVISDPVRDSYERDSPEQIQLLDAATTRLRRLRNRPSLISGNSSNRSVAAGLRAIFQQLVPAERGGLRGLLATAINEAGGYPALVNQIATDEPDLA